MNEVKKTDSIGIWVLISICLLGFIIFSYRAEIKTAIIKYAAEEQSKEIRKKIDLFPFIKK